MHYREQQQQWACSSDDTSLSTGGGNSAAQARQHQRPNGNKAVVRVTDSAVEPEIAQLEAIINSFIVASSSSSSSSLSDDVKPANHTGVAASNGSSSRKWKCSRPK
ncbi:hypothetical protein D917_10579 [Trichinella nativa]|uniref:Uncharacterized protein n=1 Tax=Trichinella nativa TaxID=6335 RepID=A0A1Y3EAC2_9BILA|nr:hypothetical protein D917_10579 [Trichinella nativa]